MRNRKFPCCGLTRVVISFIYYQMLRVSLMRVDNRGVVNLFYDSTLPLLFLKNPRDPRDNLEMSELPRAHNLVYPHCTSKY